MFPQVVNPYTFIRASASLIELACDAYILEDGDIDDSPVVARGDYYLLEYVTNTTGT